MLRFALSSYRFLGWVFLWTVTASAQPAYLVEPSEFIQKTDLIFVGSLIAQESHWTQNGMIVTDYTFEVHRALKGAADREVQITEYGGEVGDVIQQVSHTARYSAGRTYLIFSHRDEEGRHRTLAGPLGRLPLVKRDAGEDLVRLSQQHPLTRLFNEPRAFRELAELESEIRASTKSRGNR